APLKQRTITQQGTDFHWRADAFDTFARPAQVRRFNAPGEQRVEATVYHDHLHLWGLGQVASRAVGATTPPTQIAEATSYHATWAVPLQSQRFGKTVQTLGWNTTAPIAGGQRGTLNTVTDGNGNPTTLSNWKRGIPQAIHYADGHS